MKDTNPLDDLLKNISRRCKQGKRISRGIDLFGKDREVLSILSDPCWEINGIGNKELRMKLSQQGWGEGKTDKQLSARVSRFFRLLRDHGLLRKQPGRYRYNLTEKGRKVIHAATVIPSVGIDKLLDIAA